MSVYVDLPYIFSVPEINNTCSYGEQLNSLEMDQCVPHSFISLSLAGVLVAVSVGLILGVFIGLVLIICMTVHKKRYEYCVAMNLSNQSRSDAWDQVLRFDGLPPENTCLLVTLLAITHETLVSPEDCCHKTYPN